MGAEYALSFYRRREKSGGTSLICPDRWMSRRFHRFVCAASFILLNISHTENHLHIHTTWLWSLWTEIKAHGWLPVTVLIFSASFVSVCVLEIGTYNFLHAPELLPRGPLLQPPRGPGGGYYVTCYKAQSGSKVVQLHA